MNKLILIGCLLLTNLIADDIKKGMALYAKGSYKRAAKVLPKGCEAGDARSCYFAGYLFSNGLGVTQDMKRAVIYYKKGCEGKLTKSCKYYNRYRINPDKKLKQFNSDVVFSNGR